jgi:adenylate kinase family enzyme
MQRIAIIGSPGAGKTTFSKKLGLQLDIPLYHLDYYYHDNKFNYAEDKLAWRKKVTELANHPRWIIDGNYKSTFDIRFPKADTIIYLDYPRSLTLKRALQRRIKLHGRVRDDMPSNWREKFTFEFFTFIWKFNTDVRPKIYSLLETEHGKNIVILHNTQQADKYLSDIIKADKSVHTL